MTARWLRRMALSGVAAGFNLPENPVVALSRTIALRHLLAALRVNVVLDIGANTRAVCFGATGDRLPGQHCFVPEPLENEFDAVEGAISAVTAKWKGYRVRSWQRHEDNGANQCVPGCFCL